MRVDESWHDDHSLGVDQLTVLDGESGSDVGNPAIFDENISRAQFTYGRIHANERALGN
jgi:hypothetical protein